MKKLCLQLTFCVVLVLAAVSCKKDDDSPPDYISSIAGGWKYVKTSGNEKYLQVYKNKTCSVLSSDEQGIRDQTDDILVISDDQIMMDNGNPYSGIDAYNYSFKGDTLTLTSPMQRMVLARDKEAPDTSNWIKKVSAVISAKAPISSVSDIAYDGSLIWYGNTYASHYLYNYSPLSGLTDSIQINQYAWAVEADGSNLWVSSDGSDYISEIDKTTGSTITTSTTMGAWIYGIAKDNNYLWCYSNNENTLYQYNIMSNTVASMVTVQSSWDGLAFAGGDLYVASNGMLHKCTLSPLMGTESFELPGYFIYGVTYDGSAFWVSAYKLPDEWPEIIKLSGVN